MHDLLTTAYLHFIFQNSSKKNLLQMEGGRRKI